MIRIKNNKKKSFIFFYPDHPAILLFSENRFNAQLAARCLTTS